MPDPLHLLERAERSFAHEDFSAAERFLKRAQRSTSDRFLLAEIAAKRADSLRALGKFREAIGEYWKAHKHYRLAGVPSERLQTLLGASSCLRVLGQFSQARRLWKDVARMKFFGASDPKPYEVRLEVALVERGAGNLAGAQRLLSACLKQAQRVNDAEVIQEIWWALGGTERFSGRLRRSLHSYRQAEIHARRLKNTSGEIYALFGQAGTLRVLGHGTQSHKKYRQGFNLAKRVNDAFGTAYGMCGMGNALRVYGDPLPTLDLYRKSRKLYERLGDTGSAAFCSWGMGGSLRRLRKFRKSLAEYRRALDTFQKVEDARGEVMALLGIGRTLAESGSPDKAKIWRNRALNRAKAERLPFEAALSRHELGQLVSFHSLGIPTSAVRSWKDLP